VVFLPSVFALCYEFREAQEIEASCAIELIHLPKKGRCYSRFQLPITLVILPLLI
jgi:hypothetical protein